MIKVPPVKSDASELYFHFDPRHKRAEDCWKLEDWEEYPYRQRQRPKQQCSS